MLALAERIPDGRPIDSGDNPRRCPARKTGVAALNQAKVQQQSVHAGFHKAGNLAAWIVGSRNWADHQSMIKSHHQGTATRLVENPVEPNLLSKITQDPTPPRLSSQKKKKRDQNPVK